MKIIIDFDPGDEMGPAFEFLKGPDYKLLLHSLSEEMRMAAKHNNDEGAKKWRARLYELAQEYWLEIG